MAFNISEEEGDVVLENQKLKRVEDFRYLGSMMKSTETDFKRRKGLAYGAWNSMEKIWNAKHVPIKLKTNIFETSVLSILLYGCESWIITPQLEHQINTFATDCFRRMLNIKRVDKIPLESIYKQVDKRPLINTVRKRQLGWLGHALRREDEEPTKKLALYEPAESHGKPRRGAPKLSYKSQIATLLTGTKKSGISINEITNMALNRMEWNKRINDQDKLPKL